MRKRIRIILGSEENVKKTQIFQENKKNLNYDEKICTDRTMI